MVLYYNLGTNMFYILKSSKSKNLKPEIPYDLGNISLPIGSFIFDTTENEMLYNIRNDLLIFNGEYYTINNRLIFNDPIKAKLIFLKIKIDEMQTSSFSFYMPNTFKKITDEFRELAEKYPEFLI